MAIHQRYDFAHALRGIAALAVVVNHFAGVFWLLNPQITDLIGLPRLGSLPALDVVTASIAQIGLIFGQFGVGIFFIISGFVISLAIQRETPVAFLIRRVFRIYPAYIAGFLFMMAALWVAANLAGVSPIYGVRHIAAHLTIIAREPVGYARIDGISWTLEVELYFYLFMAIAGPALLKSGSRGIVLCVLGLLAASVPLVLSRRWFMGMQVSSGLMLASGVAYAMFVLNRIEARPLVLLQVGILVALSAVWVLISLRQGLSLQWLVGYHVAMAVFAVCFAYWRDKRIGGRILNHFADISYPLYVVHGLFGYTIMYGIVLSTGSVVAAIAAAFLSAWMVAWVIHRLVEVRAQRISRRLTAATPVPAPA